jgi:hypothetical protein
VNTENGSPLTPARGSELSLQGRPRSHADEQTGRGRRERRREQHSQRQGGQQQQHSEGGWVAIRPMVHILRWCVHRLWRGRVVRQQGDTSHVAVSGISERPSPNESGLGRGRRGRAVSDCPPDGGNDDARGPGTEPTVSDRLPVE